MSEEILDIKINLEVFSVRFLIDLYLHLGHSSRRKDLYSQILTILWNTQKKTAECVEIKRYCITTDSLWFWKRDCTLIEGTKKLIWVWLKFTTKVPSFLYFLSSIFFISVIFVLIKVKNQFSYINFRLI